MLFPSEMPIHQRQVSNYLTLGPHESKQRGGGDYVSITAKESASRKKIRLHKTLKISVLNS